MNKVINKRDCLINILYTVLLSLTVLFLCSYLNEDYQTLKDIKVNWAMLFFAIFMFALGKVRLFNWASLALSLVYWISSRFYVASFKGFGTDIVKSKSIQAWVFWVVLMILADMVLYRKYRDLLKRVNLVPMITYLVMAVLMVICRNERNEVLVFFVPLLVFFIIPVTKAERENLTYRIADSWLVSFVLIMIYSFIVNPYTGGRYYGAFVNIGPFGLIIGAAFASCVFRLIDARNRFGRKNPKYLLWWLWMAGLVYVTIIVNTRTLVVGLAFCLAVAFILCAKSKSRKVMRVRLLALLGIIVIAAAAATVLIIAFKDASYKEWNKIAENERGIKAVIAFTIARIPYMFNKTTSFKAKIFAPHTVMNAIDKFTSGRIALAKYFLDRSTLLGTTGEGYMVGNYFAFTSHCEYVQAVYEYGYVGGIAYIAWIIYSFVISIRRYLKERTPKWLMTILWLGCLIGLMTGEATHFYYPNTFFSFVIMLPVFMKDTDEVTTKAETKAGN